MAYDKITLSGELKFDLQFADGDNRTVTLKNPANGITLASVQSALAQHGSVFIGDKTGAAYSSFKDARTVAKTTRILSDSL